VAEIALENWCKQLDDWGFPPRMDLLKSMAQVLAKHRADQENDSKLANLGKHWIANFLDRHPTLSAKYSMQLDRQRAMENNLQSLRDYFRKLHRLMYKYRFQQENIYNMDEKGFILGYSAKAKVICRGGRRPPRITQDGTQELITVIECCSAGLKVLPSFIIYKGAGQYMGWHSETSDPEAVFASSPNGWTDDLLGVEWIRHFNQYTPSEGQPHLLILDGH
jgi:hypothetical protein